MSDDNMSDKNPVTHRLNRDDKTIVFSDKFKRKPLIRPADDEESTLVTDQKNVMLFILGMVERIDFARTPVVTLGRFDPHQKTAEEIDLGGYGAVEHGVSRSHCQLTLKDGDVVVTDLGSSNGTFVAGKRLDPDQPHTLKKGDELVLGRLPIQVMTGR